MNKQVMEQAFDIVATRWPGIQPVGGMIFGSGWSAVAEAFTIDRTLDYAEIPGLGKPGVAGHQGRLALAEIEGYRLLLFQGRRHWYEGAGWTPIALPVYLLKKMGAGILALTNAAGGLDASVQPGDLMIIKDHVNMLGTHPLIGPHDPFWGPRFPDQTQVYDRHLIGLLEQAARGLDRPVHRGVYLATSGPTYETPAEVHAFAQLGAQAVGMSTVPEAILGSAAGLKVCGVSCITNLAAGITAHPLSHEDVTRAAASAQPRMRALWLEFWKEATRDHPPA